MAIKYSGEGVRDTDGNILVGVENGQVTGACAVGGRRNLIINGAMQVAQRGTSTTTYSGYATVDRFRQVRNNLDDLAFSETQSTDAPSGFSNSLKFEVTTPEAALAADEFWCYQQIIEAQNLQHLAYGTADAKTTVLSFWVKSSVTGTYGVAIYQGDGNRVIGSTYSINSANTWEYKTISFSGDTSGVINNDNAQGFYVRWWLSAGSDFTSTDNTSWSAFADGKFAYGHAVDVIGTSGATWQITGVQLEVGSVATPFEHRSYGEELALCQRYYQKFTPWFGNAGGPTFRGSSSSGASEFVYPLPVAMRSAPSYASAQSGNSINYMNVSSGASGSATITGLINAGLDEFHAARYCRLRGFGSLSDNVPYVTWYTASTYYDITADAEL